MLPKFKSLNSIIQSIVLRVQFKPNQSANLIVTRDQLLLTDTSTETAGQIYGFLSNHLLKKHKITHTCIQTLLALHI